MCDCVGIKRGFAVDFPLDVCNVWFLPYDSVSPSCGLYQLRGITRIYAYFILIIFIVLRCVIWKQFVIEYSIFYVCICVPGFITFYSYLMFIWHVYIILYITGLCTVFLFGSLLVRYHSISNGRSIFYHLLFLSCIYILCIIISLLMQIYAFAHVYICAWCETLPI